MTRLFRLHALALLLSLATVALLASGCGRSDLLSYYGASLADGGAVDGSLDGHQDGSHTGCTSSDDCATTPATPYCELPQGVCVACLTNPDTCPVGEACDPATHTCRMVSSGCTSDSQCPKTKPICDTKIGECVGCTQSSQCPSGEICEDLQCVPSCGGGAACTEGLSCCGGGCIDEGTDPNHCGTCGRACAAGESCLGGACQPKGGCGTTGCTGGDSCCGDTCVNEVVDPAHCGSCTLACARGESCASGHCEPPVACHGGPACTGGAQCCATGCVDTTSDPANCNGCGNVCPPGDECVASRCGNVASCNGGPACTGKDTCCGRGCTDLSTDPENCNQCGLACPAGDTCVGGKCTAPASCNGGPVCTGHDQCCQKGCTDIDNDPANCGGCNQPCPRGDTCVAAQCQAPASCHGGPVCTGASQCCQNGCTNVDTDPNNCGGCNQPCPSGDTCVAAQCVPPASCHGGPVCTGVDQCCGSGCTDINTDPRNCGGCNQPCPHGESCVAAQCVVPTSCHGGPACTGVTQCCQNGCTDIDTDPANCGGCNQPCPAGDTCVAAQCQAPATCNGGPVCVGKQQCCTSGCADIDTDPKNCGGCNQPCPAGEACKGAMCQPGATCNGGPACIGKQTCCTSGCSDTTTDPNNCGGCNQPCPAGDTCVASQCTPPASCNGGPVCMGSQQCCPTGCTDTDTDPANCGGCNQPCPADVTCGGGSCQTCNGGPACTGGQACCGNGCTDTTSDPQNCGGCNQPCGPGSSCVSSMCTPPVTCNGNPPCQGAQQCCATGCSDTTSDPQNCGGCNQPCPPGEACVMSTCTVPQSCNGGPSCPVTEQCCTTGCSDTTSDPQNCGGCNQPCPPGSPCVGSICQPAMTCNGGPACTGGQQCCDSGCSDTTSDPSNCGGCNQPCPPGDSCVMSTCQSPQACNGGPPCTGGQQCCAAGCTDTTSDPSNCNGCNVVCPTGDTCVNSTCTPPTSCNGGPACPGNDSCCPAGCVDTTSDSNNCNGCMVVCPAGDTCVNSTCVNNSGVFSPTTNPTYLSPGSHAYTSINIPAGITVYVAGFGDPNATLSLSATGDITIAGTIDLSGGAGTQNTVSSQNVGTGQAGGGGFTGQPYESAPLSATCAFVGGNGGSLGDAISGSVGTCTEGSTTVCGDMSTDFVFASPPASFGGGGGVFTGFRAYGGGGGGPGGGAPGALGALFTSPFQEQDCSGASGGGGAIAGQGGSAPGAYGGTAGTLGQTQCSNYMNLGVTGAWVGGGGGGSIGTASAADLAVISTFISGSGGGGGSADYFERQQFGGTSGGGGGGGALKLTSGTSITITGSVLANGGPGGDAVLGIGADAMCTPQPGAAGGGGSGGVIYLQAPAITVQGGATVSAAGGSGGEASEFATGGAGGNGGLGRIRLSTGTPGCGTLQGSFTPALPSGCPADTATPEKVYIGTYPN